MATLNYTNFTSYFFFQRMLFKPRRWLFKMFSKAFHTFILAFIDCSIFSSFKRYANHRLLSSIYFQTQIQTFFSTVMVESIQFHKWTLYKRLASAGRLPSRLQPVEIDFFEVLFNKKSMKITNLQISACCLLCEYSVYNPIFC